MKYYVLTEFACSTEDKLLYMGCKGVETEQKTALGTAFNYIYTKYTQNNNAVQVINFQINQHGVGDIEFAFTTTDKPVKEQMDMLYDIKNRHILRIELVEEREER